MGRSKTIAICCIQAFLGYIAWFLVFAATFNYESWHIWVIQAIGMAVILAITSTGLFGAVSDVSVWRLAIAFTIVPTAWAVFVLPADNVDFFSKTFFIGLLAVLFLSAFLAGVFSRRFIGQRPRH